MRRKINILWIEDELETDRIKRFQKLVKEIIEEFYYEGYIISALNKKAAEKKLQENHIDLIFSDYNLTENKTGVEFLTEYRNNGNYKYYILYSNNEEREILNKIIEQLRNKGKIHLFSNFDFVSLSKGYETRMEEALDVFLNNRSKIEELRNMYIIENALIEDKLKIILSSNRKYIDLIDEYVSGNNVDSDTANLWHKVRIDRNILAHGTIEFENGYNIAKDDKNRIVSEENFEKKISCLKELDEKLNALNFFS